MKLFAIAICYIVFTVSFGAALNLAHGIPVWIRVIIGVVYVAGVVKFFSQLRQKGTLNV